MIVTDFRIAIRNILRNKVQSAISILGLGIGLGSMILLIALIVHEKSFEKYIPDYPNVYKVIFGSNGAAQYPLADAMKKDFPEVKDFFRINQANIIQVRNIKRNEYGRNQEFAFADSSIFKILGIKLIAGTPARSFTEVAISEKMARKYFGNTSALGEILRVKLNNEFIDLSVSGIYKDFPANSTLYPDFLATIKLSEKLFGIFSTRLGEYGSGISVNLNWDLRAFVTYVVLDKNADAKALVSKMQKYRELISNESAKKLEYDLQPVSDIYLKSDKYLEGFYFFRAGNANELKYYWALSLLILLISVINYIFLTRAATSDRIRELGTRKVLGASPKNLRRQIILESNLITLLSLIPASFVIDSGISFINTTMNKTLSNEVFTNPVMWMMLIAVVIFTGTISGLLIGYKISRISPLVLLSGKTSEISRAGNWDYSYLVFHFSIYIILVASVISVSRQVIYSVTNYKGINVKNVLVSELNTPSLQSGFLSISNEMQTIPGVIKVTGSSFIPFYTDYMATNIANLQGEKIKIEFLVFGEGMTEMLNIDVIEGEHFGSFKPGRWEVLLNESAAKLFNVKPGDNYQGVNIIGIVRDFNSHSLYTPIEPLIIFQQNPSKMGLLAIKTDGTNDKEVIKRLSDLYSQISPDEIFDVKNLEEQMKTWYLHEKNQAKIIGAFSILATVLAIMGLFGIAFISIARRTKEIGLRKVNGASIAQVIFLLNKDFVKWVLVSLFIGIPVSYYLMSVWQNRFAYKAELSWWIFAIAGISAILIAVLTISSQSWRAATRNPVEALRYE
jgi:putative ABC transport system permease protein